MLADAMATRLMIMRKGGLGAPPRCTRSECQRSRHRPSRFPQSAIERVARTMDSGATYQSCVLDRRPCSRSRRTPSTSRPTRSTELASCSYKGWKIRNGGIGSSWHGLRQGDLDRSDTRHSAGRSLSLRTVAGLNAHPIRFHVAPRRKRRDAVTFCTLQGGAFPPRACEWLAWSRSPGWLT